MIEIALVAAADYPLSDYLPRPYSVVGASVTSASTLYNTRLHGSRQENNLRFFTIYFSLFSQLPKV